MKNSVLIPLHKQEESDLLQNAIKNIKCPIYVVAPNNIKISDINVIKIGYDDKKTLSQALAFGMESIDKEWVTILYVDDQLTDIYEKNVDLYKKEYPNIKMFLPFVYIQQNGIVTGVKNEAIWAKGFTQVQGEIDNEFLKSGKHISFAGAHIHLPTYKSLGGLKTNMDIVFDYEYMLRHTYYESPIMVIPRKAYLANFDKDSRTFKLRNKFNAVQIKEFVELAKREFFHKTEREVTVE